MTSKFLSTLVVVLAAQEAFAAGSGHHGPSAVIPYAVNFVVFVGLLIYFLKTPVAEFFKNYRETFLEQSSKASEAAAAAERQKKEIEDELKKLETTYSSKIEASKKEAQALREKLVKESQDRSARLIADTNESAALLFKVAEQNIKSQILDQALKSAKTDLSKKVDVKESQRLHGEFLEEISVGSL